MNVAIHNPSTIDLPQAKIAVPHSHFSVKAYDYETQMFKDVSASVISYEDTIEDGTSVKSAFMYVDHLTAAKEISLIQLTYNETVDIHVPSRFIA